MRTKVFTCTLLKRSVWLIFVAGLFFLASCSEATCPAYTMNEPLLKKPGFPERQFNTSSISSPINYRYSDKYRKKLEKSIKKTNRDNIFVRG